MLFAADCLAGRAVIVTGAAGGIGSKIVEACAAVGAMVAATDLQSPDAEDSIMALAHDVTSSESWATVIAQALERFGRVDALINCAGIFEPRAIIDETVDGFLRTTMVNQVGVFLGMQAVLEAMAVAGGGSIVNLSSGAGLYGTPQTLAYTASKFAVRGMTKVAAREFAPHRIRVNSIHPAAVNTPMIARLGGPLPKGEGTLIGRIMEPEEVASMAVFLVSDASAYSTGSEFVCDGGLRA